MYLTFTSKFVKVRFTTVMKVGGAYGVRDTKAIIKSSATLIKADTDL